MFFFDTGEACVEGNLRGVFGCVSDVKGVDVEGLGWFRPLFVVESFVNFVEIADRFFVFSKMGRFLMWVLFVLSPVLCSSQETNFFCR